MSGKVKTAIIGAGHMGAFHANTLAFKTPNAELVAVADVSERAARDLAETVRVRRWTTDLQEVFQNTEIEAVIITTPAFTHADIITQAADAGKHVFCEKPISLDLAAIDPALEAVRRTGVKLQIGFQRRFDAGHTEAKRLIEENKLGDLYMLHSITRDPHPPSAEYLKGCGGLFCDTSAHDLDMILWLSGSKVRELYAVGTALNGSLAQEADDLDNAVIILQMENGIVATVDNSRHAVYGYDVRLEAFGSEGSVRVDGSRETPITLYSRGGVSYDHVNWYLDRFAAAYEAEMRAFAACVANDTDPVVTGDDGRAAFLLGIAAQRSLSTGLPVHPDDVENELSGYKHHSASLEV